MTPKIIWRWIDSETWLLWRALAILAALLAAFLAPRASVVHLGALLSIALVLVFLRWPPAGLATFLLATMIVPLAITTGTKTNVNVAVVLMAVLVALWGAGMWFRGDVRLLRSRPIPPLLAFACVTVLAFLAGIQPWLVFAQTAPLSAQLAGMAIFLLSAGGFLVAAHQVPDVRWLQRLVWLFLAVGGMLVAVQTVPSLYAGVRSLAATGSVLTVWLAALSFSQAAFNRSLRPVWRLLLAGVALATFYVGLVYLSATVSGWLPPITAVLVSLWVGRPRLALLLTIMGGAVAVFGMPSLLDFVLTPNQYSLDTRLEAWLIIEEIVKVNPLLGLGPANYYWYTPLFPIRGFAVSFNSHNNYVDIIAQTGLLGMVCFTWFTAEVAWLAWRLRTRVSNGFSRAYVLGALGGLAGTLMAGMLGDWFLPFVYNIGLSGFRASIIAWVFLGGILVIEKTLPDGNRPEKSRETRSSDND